MKIVPISGGSYHAIVDDEDFDILSGSRWYAYRGPSTVYAYRQDKETGKFIYMHRAIMNAVPSQRVDHRDGYGLNNTRANLRLCTQSQNCQNRCTRKDNRIGIKGIRKTPTGYSATIFVNGQINHLGTFRSAEEAATAYSNAAHEHFGEFANTGERK